MSTLSYKVIPSKSILSMAVVHNSEGREVARALYVGASEGLMGVKQLPLAVTSALNEFFLKIFAAPLEVRADIPRPAFEVAVVDHKAKFLAQLKSKISKGEISDFQAGNTLINEFMRNIVDIPMESSVRGDVSDALLAALRKKFPHEVKRVVMAESA